jgi:hypothetical protein
MSSRSMMRGFSHQICWCDFLQWYNGIWNFLGDFLRIILPIYSRHESLVGRRDGDKGGPHKTMHFRRPRWELSNSILLVIFLAAVTKDSPGHHLIRVVFISVSEGQFVEKQSIQSWENEKRHSIFCHQDNSKHSKQNSCHYSASVTNVLECRWFKYWTTFPL